MRLSARFTIGICISALCLCAQGQTPPAKEAPAAERGLPPRTAPTEYQSHAQVGTLTIAAEFVGHSVPTPQATFSTEDYVVVELGLFGAAGERIKLSAEDFSLRVNAKKVALSTQPYGMVTGNVKDPEWEPPASTKSKSKTSMGGSGGQGESNDPPAPVKVPIEVQRAMAQKVQKATLPEGDRALPVAGLIYFPYRGKTQGIRSLELLYEGPAGKATLKLQP